jgi:hypothetical protein
MEITAKLDPELVYAIIYDDLLQTREDFMDDLESERPGIFSHNAAYDKAMILKHIEALDLILEWYRDPSA